MYPQLPVFIIYIYLLFLIISLTSSTLNSATFAICSIGNPILNIFSIISILVAILVSSVAISAAFFAALSSAVSISDILSFIAFSLASYKRKKSLSLLKRSQSSIAFSKLDLFHCYRLQDCC